MTLKESALSSYQQQREKEDEESRFHYHRMLHAFAERGDFVNCEAVMKQMNESNHLPGPKAFHALVLAYVKGGYAKGALGAIRNRGGEGDTAATADVCRCGIGIFAGGGCGHCAGGVCVEYAGGGGAGGSRAGGS